MVLVFIIISGVVGSLFLNTKAGFIFGSAIGYLLYRLNSLENKINELESLFKKQVSAPGNTTPKPSTAQPEPLLPKSRTEPCTFDVEDESGKISDGDKTLPKKPPVSFVFPDPPSTRSSDLPASQFDKFDPNSMTDILKRYFTGGNTVVRVGAIVLFFGISFLIKYTVEQNIIPIEFRLAVIGIAAIGMLIFGYRLNVIRPTYALILQGCGVGILYMDIFGAMKIYHLIPFGMALLLLVGLSFFSSFLAIIQNGRALAVIGIIGGFLAPVLTSTGSGNHVMLFSYYALLNSGIVFTAKYRSWRELNLLGFLFTFVIATMWGVFDYTPQDYASTQPFLIIFFIFYVIIGLLFTKNQPVISKGYVDCTLIFGAPLVCFGLQAALVKPYEYGLAWSALAMGLLYATLARVILDRGSQAMRTLVESFMSLAVVFGTVAIPLALDGLWTAGSWALEGCAIVWIALRQQRTLARYFGLLLQLCAGFAYLAMENSAHHTIPVLNGLFLAAALVAAAALLSGYFLYRARRELVDAEPESLVCFSWGMLWWCGAGIHEIMTFVDYRYEFAWLLVFGALTSIAGYFAGNRLQWPYPQKLFKLFALLLVPAAFSSFAGHSAPPFSFGGFASWPLSAFTCYYLLRLDEAHGPSSMRDFLHPLVTLVFIFVLSNEVSRRFYDFIQGRGVWEMICWGVIPAFSLMAITNFKDHIRWPLASHRIPYLHRCGATLAVYLFIGSTFINLTSRGNPWPLPYFPFLNPLDLTQIFVLLSLIGWLKVLREELSIQPFGLTIKDQIINLSVLTFLWLNAVLLRTLHHWAAIPFNMWNFIHSDLTQTCFSIFWTLSAFAVMLGATKKSLRPLWLAGATLIGVVVIKLFLFDLNNIGTLERIVSFIGVGAICLVIGYLAPLPQKENLES